MNELLQSFVLVFSSEMGDKTQLLALLLAIKYKKIWPIMCGILVATLLNHSLATVLGTYLAQYFEASTLKWILAATFFAFALWILIPDKMDDDDHHRVSKSEKGAFLTTTVLFFFAEMGDKTQLATVALGAKMQMPLIVTAGTTLGMLGADGLAVVFGERLTKVVPLKVIRWFSAALFIVFGIAVFFYEI